MPYVPVFLIFVAAAVFFAVVTRFKAKGYGKDFEAYIEEEKKANAVWKEPIPTGDMFAPDMSLFPVAADDAGDSAVLRRQREVMARAAEKMMRFDEPLSNAELKLKYGTANLENIAEYEDNFFRFIYTVNSWAEALLDTGDETAAETVLYAGVMSFADTSKTYTMLADIYHKNGRAEDIRWLYGVIGNRNFPAKEKALEYVELKMEKE